MLSLRIKLDLYLLLRLELRLDCKTEESIHIRFENKQWINVGRS